MQWKCVSDHAEPLADGRIVAPGATIELTEDEINDEHNAARFDEGAFIKVDEAPEEDPDSSGDTTPPKTSGKSKKEANA